MDQNINRVLFLSFSGYSEYNGISKKKLAQISGLKECGCYVVNCYYHVSQDDGRRMWMVDNNILFDLGTGIKAKVKKRIDYGPILSYVIAEQITLVYIRSEHNASPFLIHFVKQLRSNGVSVVMEIPTYPYDQEYSLPKRISKLFMDRLFRKSLARQLDAIVTFSNATKIFGQRTIRISNGIDFDSIKLKQGHPRNSNEIHMIAVAEIHYWHGIDRIVAGLAKYCTSVHRDNPKVYLHIVGEFSGTREREEILPLIAGNQLGDYVILYGQLFGAALDEVFDMADIGIGSLARHRSGITNIKTLKNREYAARGLPFIYSEIDEDFEQMPYIMKIPADESPIEIKEVVDFFSGVTITSKEIRDSVRELSWKNQMQRVLDSI